MYAITLIGLAFIIGMVPFSVALSSSTYRCIEWKEALWVSLVFAVFHSVMVAVGWGVGYSVKGWLGEMVVPVALMIMFFMGLRFFVDARRKSRENRTMAVRNNRLLLGFAIVTSINTLLLGISLGLIYTGWLDFTGIVAAMVFLMSRIGILAGKRGWMNLGRVAEALGSALLVVIALIILLQYLKFV